MSDIGDDCDSWLAALLGDGVPLRFDLQGFPMFFEPRIGWEAESAGIELHLFYFCLRGRLLARVAGVDWRVERGKVLWIKPRQAFRIRAQEAAGARIARFRAGFERARRGGPRISPESGCLVGSASTAAWLEAVRVEASARRAGAERRRALRLALAGLFSSLEVPGPPDRSEGGFRELSPRERERIEAWIDSRPPASRPGCAQLAELLALSPDYCARLFRRSYGQSVEEWIIARRIRSAGQRLLESRLSIAQVAEEFGYSSPFFFSRQFRQVQGCSPREYRSRA